MAPIRRNGTKLAILHAKKFEDKTLSSYIACESMVCPLQAFIAGATAPQSKWEDDGVRLRSAAISLTLL